MKGTWCTRNPSVFCQEDSGCDNCTVKPANLYKASVEVHDLRHIDTEPPRIVIIKQADFIELTKSVGNVIRDNIPRLHGGFAITVTYTKENNI